MPQVEVDGLRINYDVQGNGEPLLLIPYTSADHACYAFQLPVLYRAFQLHRARPPRLGRKRHACGAVLDRGLCRPGRRLPRCYRGR